MNLYGDRGNVIALVHRAGRRGIDVEVVAGELGKPIEWQHVDLVFMGGGEDSHQSRIAEDFLLRAPELTRRLDDGIPMLAICGAYQLLGHYYRTVDGQKLPGIGYLDVTTEPGRPRAIGDVVCETALPIVPATLVGFENHGGRTFLGSGATPLATIYRGQGNNGQDHTEGAMKLHTIGTYLHGSLLPKNPHLTDLLLSWAVDPSGSLMDLAPMDMSLEMKAHELIVARGEKVR
ncbi:MAG: type 1 glutamine amidotransferase, partial [Sulfobacillus sp.]